MFQVWSVVCGVWGVGCGVWGVGFHGEASGKARRGCTPRCLMASEYGTYKISNARFRPWLSGKSPQNVFNCSLFAQKRRGPCLEPFSRAIIQLLSTKRDLNSFREKREHVEGFNSFHLNTMQRAMSSLRFLYYSQP